MLAWNFALAIDGWVIVTENVTVSAEKQKNIRDVKASTWWLTRKSIYLVISWVKLFAQINAQNSSANVVYFPQGFTKTTKPPHQPQKWQIPTTVSTLLTSTTVSTNLILLTCSADTECFPGRSVCSPGVAHRLVLLLSAVKQHCWFHQWPT